MDRSRILLIATILQSVTLTMTFAVMRSIDGHGPSPSDHHHHRGGGRLLRQTQTAAIADWTSGFATDGRPSPEIQRNLYHRDLPGPIQHVTPPYSAYSSGDWTPVVITPRRQQNEGQQNVAAAPSNHSAVAGDRPPDSPTHRRPEPVSFVTLPPSLSVVDDRPPHSPTHRRPDESVAFVTFPPTAELHGNDAVFSGDGQDDDNNIIIYIDRDRNHSQPNYLSNDQNGKTVDSNDNDGNDDNEDRGFRLPQNAEVAVAVSAADAQNPSGFRDEHATIVVDEAKRREADPKQNAVVDVLVDRDEKSAGRPDPKDGEHERRGAEKDHAAAVGKDVAIVDNTAAAAAGRRRNQPDRRETERRRLHRRRPVAAAGQRRRKVQSSSTAAPSPRTERRTRRPPVADNSHDDGRGEQDNHGEYRRRGGSTTLNNDKSIETTTRRQTTAAVVDEDEDEDEDATTEGQLRGGYGYGYTVLDEDSGMDFGQWEHREPGRLGTVTGQYRVRLPDGRIQTVEYTVSSDTGYKASVSYDGVQHHHTPSVVAQHG